MQTIIVAMMLAMAGAAAPAGSVITLEGNLSFWFVVEENESGTLQAGSRDLAAQESSGFNFKQGRLAVRWESGSGALETLIRLRLEERTDIIDLWGAWHVAPWLSIHAGQMKIPATREVLTEDHLTDFAVRATFGQNSGNFALAKTPYTSSLMNANTNNRDIGLALKGDIFTDQGLGLSYFLMVGNGAGAGLYTGGPESPEFFYANNFGDFYYGGRIEVTPYPGIVAGYHASSNVHENTVLQDKKTVVDLDREVWTADLEIDTTFGTRFYGFYGEGRMEDFFFSEGYLYDYYGWGLTLMQSLFEDRLEVGVRYDIFTTEFNENEHPTSQENLTWGANLMLNNFRLQINYMEKYTDDDFMPDIDDNIFIMNFQYMFAEPLM